MTDQSTKLCDIKLRRILFVQCDRSLDLISDNDYISANRIYLIRTLYTRIIATTLLFFRVLSRIISYLLILYSYYLY